MFYEQKLNYLFHKTKKRNNIEHMGPLRL